MLLLQGRFEEISQEAADKSVREHIACGLIIGPKWE